MCIAPIALLSAYFSDYSASRERDLGNGASTVRSFGHMYTEQVSRALAGVDLLIDEQTQLLDDQPLWTDWPESRGHELLRAHKPLSLPQLRDTAIFDASGRQRFHSSLFPAPALNISDRPYFKELKAGNRRVLWGPFKGGNSGLMTYAVTRRIFKRDGSFAGVAFAALELAQFQSTCWNGKPDDKLLAFLLNEQGSIIAECRPPDEVLRGVSNIGAKLESRYPPQTKLDWRTEGVSSLDEQVVSVHRVPGYSELSVVVSLPKDVILAAWKQNQRRNQLTLAAVLLVMLGCFRYIWLQMQRQSRTEATLRKLSLAVEQSSASIIITNRDAVIEYVNDAFIRNSGYGRDEVLGHTPHMLGSGKTPAETYRSMWSALEQGGSWRGEFVNRRKDGGEHVEFAIITPLRNEDGLVTHFVAVHEDVTEKQRLGEELEQHRHHLEELVNARTTALRHQSYSLQALIDNLPHMAWMKDKAGRFIAVNRGIAGPLGQTTAELIGKTDVEFLPRELGERNRAEDLEVMETRRAKVLEEPAGAVPGSLYEIFKAPIFDADGSVLGTVGFARDIKPQRAMEAELARRAEAAEAASLAKSSFLSNMSHEIRTPMNAILGMAHLLRRTDLSPTQANRLDKIETAGDHLLHVIDDILDLSKIEAGKFVLDDAPVSISKVLTNTGSIMSARAQAKGLRLMIEKDSFPSNLQGDPTRLQQAVLNYVGNAIKFTKDGVVTLRAIKEDETEKTLSVRFEVEDTGIGIPAEALSRLFSAFEQADNSTNRQFGGTGLGLVITRRLAELMGGEAGARSTPGIGSTFWFTAHLEKKERRVDIPQAVAIDAEILIRNRYQGSRILLVDDEPVNLEVAHFLLEGAGLVVDTAEDGGEAIDQARRTDYAMILMDMQMPNVDGLAATRQIRGLPGYQDIPILAMTANAFAEDRVRCLDAGMNDSLIKPFDPEMLFAAVLKHLERRSRQSDLNADAPTVH